MTAKLSALYLTGMNAEVSRAYMMKFLFVLYLIFNFFFANQLHALNLDKIQENLNQLEQLIQKNHNDTIFLFRIKIELINTLAAVDACIQQENKYLLDQNKEFAILKNIKAEPIGLDLQNQSQINVKKHSDRLYLCQYQELKVKNLINQIQKYNHDLFIKNLFLRDVGFNLSFIHLQKNIWTNTQNIYSEMVESKIIKRYLFFVMSMLFFSLLVYTLKKYNPSHLLVRQINQKKLFHTIALFSISAPVLFLLFYSIYFQKNELLRNFFTGRLSILAVYSYIFGLYMIIKVKSYTKDYLFIFPIFLLSMFILFYSMNLINIRLIPNSALQIVRIKYWIFIALQPIQISILYWFFSRIIKFQLDNKGLKISILASLISIFVLGLNGYLNLAAYINFLVIINFLHFGLLIIYTKIFKSTLDVLRNKQSKTYQYLQKKFDVLIHLAISSIKILVNTLYIIFITYVGLAILMVTNPFLTEYQLDQLYGFIYGQKLFTSLDLSINQITAGFILFNLFNLINYWICSLFARKIYRDKSNQIKTTKVFVVLGYIINIIIIILILNIHIKNIGIISGAAFIGLGVVLQSSISKFFSGFILYINPPFRVGDYVEIQNTKGFVKKISWLETLIETSDNNIIILPNQIISSSKIENYNFENKSFQKIHINYILDNLDIQKEELIKIKLHEVLVANKYVFKDIKHPIAFIFSLLTQTTDTYNLEIIFCYHTKTNMKQELTQLNRELANMFKSFGIDATFQSMYLPYD